MVRRLVLFSLTLLVCKAHSQLCGPPILPPPCPAPCIPIPCEPTLPPCSTTCPQVINPNPYVTTIIDNSVSNALVNALQLLIVSNLIGSTLCPSTPILNNLGPLLDSLVCPNSCAVEIPIAIPEYITCGTSYEIPVCSPITTCAPYYDVYPPCGPVNTYGPYYDVPPCGSISPCSPYYETIFPPCGPIPTCGPYYDTIFPPCGPIPTCGPYYDNIIPPCGPISSCGPYYETIIPSYGPMPPCNPYYETVIPSCGPVIDPYLPPFCGLTEIISPNYFTYTETITPLYTCIDPIPCNGYGEALCPVYETFNPNFYSGLTEVLPNYINYPVNDVCPPLCSLYGGFSETITPTVAALPNMFGCLNEVIAPCVPNIYASDMSPFGSVLASNYYGGLEIPLAAEVVFPSSLPAQLSCNFGYPPSTLPCVRVNVEPIGYDNCLCNGYGGPIYY